MPERPRPWLRPPSVRTPADGALQERQASWLELFFDLVFVVAIAELARQLVLDHSLGGFGIFAGLFLPVFIAWQRAAEPGGLRRDFGRHARRAGGLRAHRSLNSASTACTTCGSCG
jgi:Bacterial low temperature requirement A protein (LtrA)